MSEEAININTIKNSFIKSGITNNISQLSTDNIELPKELVILNSMKDEDVEILKKYNLDKGELEKNYTLDRFLLKRIVKKK